jgi:hypothetical protein
MQLLQKDSAMKAALAIALMGLIILATGVISQERSIQELEKRISILEDGQRNTDNRFDFVDRDHQSVSRDIAYLRTEIDYLKFNPPAAGKK